MPLWDIVAHGGREGKCRSVVQGLQEYKKKSRHIAVAGFLKVQSKNQRLENWGARRAALRPYFNRLSDDFP